MLLFYRITIGVWNSYTHSVCTNYLYGIYSVSYQQPFWLSLSWTDSIIYSGKIGAQYGNVLISIKLPLLSTI